METTRRLKVARSVACGKVTSKTNEVEAIRTSSNRIDKEELQKRVKEWDEALANLEEAHAKYAARLSQEEQEKDVETWTAPVFNGFNAAKQSIHRFLQKVKERPETPDSVHASDSVSVTKSSRSYRSSMSSSSSIALARADAAAKKAELLARAANLKKKRALQEKATKLKRHQQEQEIKRKEMEAQLQKEREEEDQQRQEAEEEIKREQEQLEVDEELAGADARLQALDEIDNQSILDLDSIHIHEGDSIPVGLNPQANKLKHYSAKKTAYGDIKEELAESTNSDMLNIISQQTQLSKMLIESQMKTSLPQRAVPIFDGNPLEYASWLSAFNHGVESRCSEAADKLFYLHQFTAGEVQKVVSSFMRKDPDVGYRQAKEYITSNYGNRHQIADAYMKRADNLPPIKSEDASALTSFSLFLTEYYNVMESLSYESELDHIFTIKMLVQKLPYKLRERWRTITSSIHENRSVVFTDLTTFVKRQAKISANPIYGEIKEVATNPTTSRTTSHRAYATHTTTNEPTATTKTCIYCGKSGHEILQCFSFAKLSMEEKLSGLRQKGVCFGCLKRGSHIKRDCKAKLSCEVCTKIHPTILHDDQYPQLPNAQDAENSPVEELQPSASQQSDASNEAHVTSRCTASSCVTGAGDQGYLPPIIPVLVRAKDSGIIVPTYAFLDEGSSAVFCTNDLKRKLKTTGQPTQLTVETLNQTKTVASTCLNGLEIISMMNSNKVELPHVYTQESIPVSKKDIIHETDIRRWPHLRSVSMPTLDAEIGLLIGNNVPLAMEPLRVINSDYGGPFACETVLGWVVHGFPAESPRPTTSVNRVALIAEGNLPKMKQKKTEQTREIQSLNLRKESKIGIGSLQEMIDEKEDRRREVSDAKNKLRLELEQLQGEAARKVEHLTRIVQRQENEISTHYDSLSFRFGFAALRFVLRTRSMQPWICR